MDSASVDVVIIGAGLAGCCAAIEALDCGAEVLLLEKGLTPGGSSASGPGSFAFADTDLQRRLGLQDSLECLRNDLIAAGHGKSRLDLIDRYVELQLDTYHWLLGKGFVFERVEASTYQSVPRSHPISAAHVVKVLFDEFLRRDGSQYLRAARVETLIRNARSGKVDQIRVALGGQSRTITAHHGVIIASGGFARSDALIEKFAPQFVRAVRMGGTLNEGDGLRMAWALGADVVDTGYLSGTFGASLNRYPDTSDKSGRECIILHPIYKGAIAVNLKGQRFADESQSYKTLGSVCLAQPEAVAFQLFDQAVMEQSVPEMMPRNFKAALDKGLVKIGRSWAELAAALGLDGQVLTQTVARYNGFAQQGYDSDFGRKHLIGAMGSLVELGAPPYYAYPCTTALLSTYGGIAIDAQARVLDVYGQPIDGLYAAGEVTGGLHGASYLSGSSLAKSAIFGRVAGCHAATRRSRPVAQKSTAC
jgi:fumarate reductase flavoprotein subunit